MKDYINSPYGVVKTKIIIYSFIIFGLFAGGIERFIAGDNFLAIVLVGFGCLQLFDYRVQWKAWLALKQQRESGMDLDSLLEKD